MTRGKFTELDTQMLFSLQVNESVAIKTMLWVEKTVCFTLIKCSLSY